MATKGEQMVRVEFNPSGEGVVYDIKRHIAEQIDFLEKLRQHKPSPEAQRCISIAQTHLETAAMFAVKAATAE